jgi:ABC-type spermidine/putrescine transport system permease subunit I
VAAIAPARAVPRARRLERSRIAGIVLVLPSLVYLTVFVFIPVVKAFSTSFTVRDRDDAGNYTYRVGVDNYTQLIESPTLRDNVIFTVLIAVISVAIVFVIAYAIALALRFGKGPAVRLLSRIYIVPLFIPSVIASYAMITFLANHGFVDGILQALGLPDGAFPKIVFDWKGIVITQVWLSLPFMTVLLSSVLLEIGDSLVESARDVGASSWQILRHIVLPLSAPGALIGVTFLFLGVVGGFTVPYLLGPNAPQMLGVSMVYYMTNYFEPFVASTQAVVIFLLSLVAAVYYVRQQFKREVR